MISTLMLKLRKALERVYSNRCIMSRMQAMNNYKGTILTLSLSVFVVFVVFQCYTSYNSGITVHNLFYLRTQKRNPNKCASYSFDYRPSFIDKHLELPGFYRKLDDQCKNNEDKVKYIYANHDFYGWLGNMSKAFDNCPIKNCVMTMNKTRPMEEFDAIIFSIHTTNQPLPEKRKPNQKYIYFTLEAPYSTPPKHDIKNFYNWTMNHRRDADIHFPYQMIDEKKTGYTPPSYQKFQNKTKMAAWLVSNCGTPGTKRRRTYVQELQKYIQVDIYGGCGTLKCDPNCYEKFESEYMFYLAFENSMCYDYVTEKTFNLLKYDIIPVVMGYSDYSSIVPPSSVINVDHFSHPKSLAEYLIKISNNYQLYLEYMEWKKNYVVTDPYEYTLCQLCDMLHRPLQYSNYEDIQNWFHSMNCYIYN